MSALLIVVVVVAAIVGLVWFRNHWESASVVKRFAAVPGRTRHAAPELFAVRGRIGEPSGPRAVRVPDFGHVAPPAGPGRQTNTAARCWVCGDLIAPDHKHL